MFSFELAYNSYTCFAYSARLNEIASTNNFDVCSTIFGFHFLPFAIQRELSLPVDEITSDEPCDIVGASGKVTLVDYSLIKLSIATLWLATAVLMFPSNELLI